MEPGRVPFSGSQDQTSKPRRGAERGIEL
jgi:hypothetical protein